MYAFSGIDKTLFAKWAALYFKLATFVYRSLHNADPQYLSSLLQILIRHRVSFSLSPSSYIFLFLSLNPSFSHCKLHRSPNACFILPFNSFSSIFLTVLFLLFLWLHVLLYPYLALFCFLNSYRLLLVHALSPVTPVLSTQKSPGRTAATDRGFNKCYSNAALRSMLHDVVT